MNIKEFAEKTGMDLEGTSARFGGMDALVIKFLHKFSTDESFPALSRAVSENDYAAIETAAHTLKGVAGNLGFMNLYEINQKIVDAVRGKQYESIEPYFREDEEIYKQILECLQELD